MSTSDMQTEHAETCATKIDWLYPELLSTEGLIEILKQRYLVPSDLYTLERQKLLELYYQHAIPLPQRKYRPNRRGREMTRKQIVQAKKRRQFHPVNEFEPPEKKSYPDDGPTPRFMTSASTSCSSEERLKPPPSQINFDRKTIKLGGAGKQASSLPNITRITFSDSDETMKPINDGTLPTSSKVTRIPFSNSGETMKSVGEETACTSPKFTRIIFSDCKVEKVSKAGDNDTVVRTEENSSKSTLIPITFSGSKVDLTKKVIRLNSSSPPPASSPVSNTMNLIKKHLCVQDAVGSTYKDMKTKNEVMAMEGLETEKYNETEKVPRKKVKIKRIFFT